jgi:uncharacterized membrane protein (DUF4010 family)
VDDNLILRLGLALAIGFLVGLERGWRERDQPAGSRTAGIRTYALAGLLGGIIAALAAALGGVGGGVVIAAGLVAFAGVFAWFKARELEHDAGFSVTGVVAALGVFALGGLAVAGDYRAAAAGGVTLAAVLASREVLHGLLRKISWVELRSTLLLAGMTAIGLSLLPNRTIDPWGGVNPWEIWLFTVLTAAISYAGYIAIRVLGPGKGILVSGLAGALVSSTAVTVAFARRAKAGDPVRPLAGGAMLAAMISVLRVFTIVVIVRPELGFTLAPPVFAAALVFGGLGGALLYRSTDDGTAEAKLGNPFDLGPLLLFAASFAVIAAASAALSQFFGGSGVILTSAVAGTLDVDVASLSAARQTGASITAVTASAAILAAIATNAVARVVAAAAVGPLRYALPFLGATLAAIAAGGAAFWLLPPA